MSIPSGSGTEVLKRQTATGDFDSNPVILTVPTDHIFTIISLNIVEAGSASEIFWLTMTDASNSNRVIDFVRSQVLTANQTFIYSDRIILNSGDTLKLQSGSVCNMDVYISYIDQDWT